MKKKIAFIWYWGRASEIISNWRDGYTAAVEEIGKIHDVDVFIDEQLPTPEDNYDFIWIWADPNSPIIPKLAQYPGRKGVSLTTMPQDVSNLQGMDVVYCESQPIVDVVKAAGLRAIKAFGTDTDFFYPNPEIKKDILFFYPATFSPWKRQSELAYLGNKLTCIGTIQPDGDAEYKACVDSGVNLEVGYFPVKKIRDYYWRTESMIIPAVHGSERTVLEAMAMNIPVELTHADINKKTASYELEYLKSNCKTTREFVLKNYSHIKFAEAIVKGING